MIGHGYSSLETILSLERALAAGGGEAATEAQKTGIHHRGAEHAEIFYFKLFLCVLGGDEKKSKNNKIRKIGINKINHL